MRISDSTSKLSVNKGEITESLHCGEMDKLVERENLSEADSTLK